MNDNIQGNLGWGGSRMTYDEEKKVADDRWSKTELLKDMAPSHKRASIAVMLENQRLMNEVCTFDMGEELKKKLIPLVLATWKDNLIWNWVSVQPMLGPVSLVYYRGIEGIVQDIEMVAATRRFKTTVADDFGVMDRGHDFANEIECEVLKDLWNNAGSAVCVDLKVHTGSDRQFYKDNAISNALKHVISRGVKIPNFLVVNPEVKSRYPSVLTDLGYNVDIYSHSGVPGVLWGNSGEGFDTSYVYSPYIPFTASPTSKQERHAMLNRYGKRLLPTGHLVYGKLSLLDDEEKF